MNSWDEDNSAWASGLKLVVLYQHPITQPTANDKLNGGSKS
jgi:hypothetical protein